MTERQSDREREVKRRESGSQEDRQVDRQRKRHSDSKSDRQGDRERQKLETERKNSFDIDQKKKLPQLSSQREKHREHVQTHSSFKLNLK